MFSSGLDSSETAEYEILNRVRRCFMVNCYACYFFEQVLESVGHRLFGVLFDIYPAAVFWTLLRECPDH